jgi:hypothetical protein
MLQLAAGSTLMPVCAAFARRSEAELSDPQFTGAPVPVGGWANSSLAYTANVYTVSNTADQVFCEASGASSYYLMAGPTTVNGTNLSDAKLIKNNPQGQLLAGWFYLNGRWPRLRTTWAAGWSSSTCIAAQVPNSTVHRFFLFDPALGQNVTVELLNAAEVPTGITKAYAVSDLKDVENGDMFIEVVLSAGVPAFQGDWQKVSDNAGVQAEVTAIKARAVTAGIRT